jgi:hypothetical protein
MMKKHEELENKQTGNNNLIHFEIAFNIKSGMEVPLKSTEEN